MAQQVDPASTINPSNYAENHVPQFAGGSVDPNSGNLIPATASGISQGQAAPLAAAPAPAAPAPATPTTRLGNVGADTPAAAPPSLGSLGASLGKATANAAAPYVGSTVGASIGGQVGGGASFGDAALNTTRGIGDVLSSGYSPTAATDSFISGTGSVGSSGAIGAGLGAGLVTAGIGALTGEQPKTYVPRAVGAGLGGYVGDIAGGALGSIFGPGGTIAGAAIGGALGSTVGGYIGANYQSAEKAVGNAVVKPVTSFLHRIFS